MQNVVDVACSSPPVAMNATKPAAQAVQAVDQDPFGLVLQKASDRIVNDKQSDSARKCSDSKSTDNSHGSDSTVNKKVSETKNDREVIKSDKTKKAEKPEKDESSDNVAEKKADTDPSTMVYGYVTPDQTVIDTVDNAALALVDSSAEAAAEAVQPSNLVQIATVSTEQTKTVDSDQAPAVASVLDGSENQDTKVLGEQTVTFAETLKNGAKIGEKTTTDLEPADGDPNAKMAGGGKVNVSTSTNSQGEAVISISNKYQEAAANVEASSSKTVKSSEVGTSQQTAPPDNPEGTTGVAASAAVQTSTQISEPARLAEAPKNEVITQVANQLDQMVKTNRSSLRLQLYPEELGHIDLLGAYGFLGLKKNKPDFLKHTATGIKNLATATSNAGTLPVLNELARICMNKLSSTQGP